MGSTVCALISGGRSAKIKIKPAELAAKAVYSFMT
jgi:hypothetical protein